jgi:tetratricopeptide (TPR) repeat protein
MRSFRTVGLAQIAIVAVGSVFTPTRVQSQGDSAAVEQRMHELNSTALSHVRNGEYAAAIGVYEEAIRMKPESTDLARSRARRWVQNNLAWLLATAPDSAVRDGVRALALAEQLVAWRRDDAAYLDTFAAAYAELGRFDDAVKTQRAAVARLGRGATRDEYRRHLKSYEERKPWREP